METAVHQQAHAQVNAFPHGQRAPLGVVSSNHNVNLPNLATMTLGRGRMGIVGANGGGSDSGRVSSGDSDRDKWSVTPDGYYTISKVS